MHRKSVLLGLLFIALKANSQHIVHFYNKHLAHRLLLLLAFVYKYSLVFVFRGREMKIRDYFHTWESESRNLI